MSIKEIILASSDAKYPYMILSRLKMDLAFYFGHGNRHDRQLWSGTIDQHLKDTQELFDHLSQYSTIEWLDQHEIDWYKVQNKLPNTGPIFYRDKE